MSAAASSAGPDWLPSASVEDELSVMEPWRPSGIERLLEPRSARDDPRWDQLRHVVIDELDENTVGLVISAWPRIDERGRLRFGGEDASNRIATVASALLTVLEEERVVPVDNDPSLLEALRRRELVVGDVFAAFLAFPHEGENGGGGGPGIVAPDELFRRPVLDISAEARDAVKAQASAAASGVIDEAFLELLDEEFRDEEPPPTAPETPPVPDGSGSSGGAAEESGVGDETTAPTGNTEASALEAETEELRQALHAPSEEQSSESRQDKPMSMGA